MMTPVRVRFAPSPTGYLHVGAARTALFNWLLARHTNGLFILRIEDTDRTRFQKDSLDEIYESLRWLGLEWDEGPESGGDYGPYVQSERVALYQQHAQQLLDSGHAYRCFCSAQRLAEMRENQEKSGAERTGYDRTCRHLDASDIERHLDREDPYVIRFRIPDSREIIFSDAIRGKVIYQSDVLDDFVLLKSDGFPTYHLANVVDDHLMAISHVLRGEEWIASTPRHALMYEAFQWEPPVFVHLPVILAPGGGKLSKRKGAASVLDYKRAGFLPDALINFIALLGWNPGDDREIMSRTQLFEAFNLEQVSPKASAFDETKLEWMNGQYLAEADASDLIEHVLPFMIESGLITENPDTAYLAGVIGQLKSRARRIPEMVESAVYYYRDPEDYEEKAVQKIWMKEGTLERLEAALEALKLCESWDESELENCLHNLLESLDVGAGKLFQPIRLALTGKSASPGLYEMMALLGRETSIRRLEKARILLAGMDSI